MENSKPTKIYVCKKGVILLTIILIFNDCEYNIKKIKSTQLTKYTNYHLVAGADTIKLYSEKTIKNTVDSLLRK
jgi:hypothetical protein